MSLGYRFFKCTGYRQEQDARMQALERENAELRKRVAELERALGLRGT